MRTRRARTTRRTASPPPETRDEEARLTGGPLSFSGTEPIRGRRRIRATFRPWGEKGAGNAGTHSEHEVAVPRADPGVRRCGPAARAPTRRGAGGREGLEPLGGAA